MWDIPDDMDPAMGAKFAFVVGIQRRNRISFIADLFRANFFTIPSWLLLEPPFFSSSSVLRVKRSI